MNPPSAIIIPAWKRQADDVAYTNISSVLRATGHDIVLQTVPWHSRTFGYWTDSIAGTISLATAPVTVVAFGLGAMAAMAAAARMPVENMLVCSPCGYFKEYFDNVPVGEQRWMGDSRKAEFTTLSAKELLGNLKVTNGFILVDEGEFVARPAYKQWIEDIVATAGWQLIRIGHEPYGVISPGYQKAIITTIKSLPSLQTASENEATNA